MMIFSRTMRLEVVHALLGGFVNITLSTPVMIFG
jgi:hypothetical protein